MTTCPACGASVAADNNFCPNCGGNFAPRPIRPEAVLGRLPPSDQRVLSENAACAGKRNAA